MQARVYIETRFTPRIKLYDSDTSGDGTAGRIAKKIMAPKLILTDDEDRIIAQYGEGSKSLFPFLMWGLVFIAASKVLNWS